MHDVIWLGSREGADSRCTPADGEECASIRELEFAHAFTIHPAAIAASIGPVKPLDWHPGFSPPPFPPCPSPSLPRSKHAT